MNFQPRPKQAEVLAYRSGRMGVSAVPGSGKTWTLSRLAADILTRGDLYDDQEVLIVTLVNSAVDNFSQRISQMVEQRGMLPYLGYRVRTLHGLSHDIVRERPDLAGLSSDFQILDERVTAEIRREISINWLRANPNFFDNYLSPDLQPNKRQQIQREQLPHLLDNIANAFIRSAKDAQESPASLRHKLENLPLPLPLAQMGWQLYNDYQRALNYRGAVDFDDLIRLALFVLQQEPAFTERLRARWTYILEDEAQDSSKLQEEILSLLSGPNGNWVRVGDPNQAIYETFTTASPEHLRSFMQQPDVQARELPNSGRSTHSIIHLANLLIDWTQFEHPVKAVRSALVPPYIEPTPPGDPQPNPPDEPDQIFLQTENYTPERELTLIAKSLARFLEENPQTTVAALVPSNERGSHLVEVLKKHNIQVIERLNSSNLTRVTAGALGKALRALAEPQSASKLSEMYKVWRRAAREDKQQWQWVEQIASLIRKCTHLETYLYPQPLQDWLDTLELPQDDPIYEELHAFRAQMQRWQQAVLLPIDQLLLTLAQDLFTEPTDLAIAHKLAGLLRQTWKLHPAWGLPELSEELVQIARNERRFIGFADEDTGFDPEQHRGKVVVSTVHKAKGLEWDRVYLLSVNNYDYPSAQSYDSYIGESWYLRDSLNLTAETLSQLHLLTNPDPYEWYEEGAATRAARLEYTRERLRLLYVGITRARRQLIITSNNGRMGKNLPAEALIALAAKWQAK
ncbi:MAG: ATP-dependent helicase [Anaerolineales bacterium]